MCCGETINFFASFAGERKERKKERKNPSFRQFRRRNFSPLVTTGGNNLNNVLYPLLSLHSVSSFYNTPNN
jgi:hypothetical protein